MAFSEAVEDLTRRATKIQARDYQPSGRYPIIDQGQREIAGYTNRTEGVLDTALPVVVFGDHTRRFKLADRPFFLGADGAKVLHPRHDGIIPEFLFHFFNSVRLPDGGYSRHFKHLREVEIPLPPLDEQHRIVDILNRANGIRRLRRKALDKTRHLIPALFVDMFGDPASNPKGWLREHLGLHVQICAPLELPDLVEEARLPCFGPEAIESNTGAWLKRTTVHEASPMSGKYRYRAGEVLYSKIRPYLAKAAIAHDSGFISADMYPLACGETLVPAFLWQTLLSSAFTNYAKANSTRAQMPKLNRRTLFAYQICLPPIALQQEFGSRVADIQATITQQERMAEASEHLVAALTAQLLDGAASKRDALAAAPA